ncbi:hypothetical protein COC69_15105 [Bacillus cereus]|uniref:Uncharacterized protein n=1 Tax=Bacillus cereus TaxID=1396 RepID=A0A9X7CMU4_BACCE|nr:hypothetical protein [Bacillus cereus]PGS78523.1 hypothetical protein COC69_15105 [Bacillus cereus]
MFSFEKDAMLVNDREDLIAVLRMRFGEISGGIIEKIYAIHDMNSLQRLILAAANAMNCTVFLDELQANEYSFRLLGEDFNPMGDVLKGRDDSDGEKEK